MYRNIMMANHGMSPLHLLMAGHSTFHPCSSSIVAPSFLTLIVACSFNRDLEAETNRKITTEVFDAVVVANGHHSMPRYTPLFITVVGASGGDASFVGCLNNSWPEKWPGQDDFKGHLMHSHSYKDPTSCGTGYNFHDKRVVIVGIGNSGVDIANELSRCSKQVYLSTRSGAWIYPKFIEGIAFDHYLMPPRVLDLLLPDCLRFNAKFYGWLAKEIEYEVTKAQGTMESCMYHHTILFPPLHAC